MSFEERVRAALARNQAATGDDSSGTIGGVGVGVAAARAEARSRRVKRRAVVAGAMAVVVAATTIAIASSNGNDAHHVVVAPRHGTTAPTTAPLVSVAPNDLVRFPANAVLAASHTPRATPVGTDVKALVDGNSAFAFDLYRQLAKTKGNLVFSPASISNAISMLAGGARANTLAQIDKTLHFTLPESQMHAAFNALDQLLAAPRHAEKGEKGSPLRLEQTDAVWGQRGFPFVRAYLDLLARDYGAGLRLADFMSAAEAERVKINAYVAAATKGKIKELFAKGIIDDMTRMVLVNTIWFKGDWKSPFEHGKTTPAPFTRLDQTSVMTPMMHGAYATRSLLHSQMRDAPDDHRDYQAVELPYVGGASMLVVEPNAGKFAGVERRFGPALLREIDQASRPYGPEVSMPKFSFGSKFSMADTLAAMGMPDVFGSAADLSGIDGARDLFVGAVEHQATIAVDEKGTEAAAATGVVVYLTAFTPTVTLDHPFLYVIRDDATGAILFAGRVLDPSKH